MARALPKFRWCHAGSNITFKAKVNQIPGFAFTASHRGTIQTCKNRQHPWQLTPQTLATNILTGWQPFAIIYSQPPNRSGAPASMTTYTQVKSLLCSILSHRAKKDFFFPSHNGRKSNYYSLWLCCWHRDSGRYGILRCPMIMNHDGILMSSWIKLTGVTPIPVRLCPLVCFKKMSFFFDLRRLGYSDYTGSLIRQSFGIFTRPNHKRINW